MTKSQPPKSLVLYADDDPDDIDLVREAFREYSPGIEVISFSDGEELLDYLQQLDPLEPLPCLVILDINMPKKDGKSALKSLRSMEAFEEVPVVLFSTSTLPSEAAFAKSFNAGFVTKPLYGPQMNHLVDRMIQHCGNDVKEFFKNKRSN